MLAASGSARPIIARTRRSYVGWRPRTLRERVLNLHVLIFLGRMLGQPTVVLRMDQPMMNPLLFLQSSLRIVTTLHPRIKLKARSTAIRTWSMSLRWR